MLHPCSLASILTLNFPQPVSLQTQFLLHTSFASHTSFARVLNTPYLLPFS